MGNGGILASVFILSLFFSSFFIAYFDIGFNGSTEIQTFELPNSLPSYFGAQNFKSGQYNTSIVSITGLGNTWAFFENEGMKHTSVSLLPYMNYFCIKDLEANSANTYINTYVVNNTIQKPYALVLRYTGTGFQNDLYIDDKGLHIPDYSSAFGIKIGDKEFISYPDADKIIYPKITTTYYEGWTDKDSSLTVNFNGNEYSFTNLNRMSYAESLIIRTIYYAGIYSQDEGTILESFNSENRITNPDTSINSNPLTLVSSLITSMLKLMVYSFPYDVIPLEFQVLLIAPQEFLILIGIAIFIREG